ncbi:MAG: OsmC family peroxiredoxin [Gemmatimonadetes bacterium]|nr:OsmC family peroxiredoxin [Gemmatimonadota bacterium]
MPMRKGSAEWKGNFAEGTGTVVSESGALRGAYSASSRFEAGQGTNPEELIASAHAACFSMALAAGLTGAGHAPQSVKTEAQVHIEKGEGGWSITRIDLKTEARVPGITEAAFQEQAGLAKKSCPISRALAAVPIHLEAHLV